MYTENVNGSILLADTLVDIDRTSAAQTCFHRRSLSSVLCRACGSYFAAWVILVVFSISLLVVGIWNLGHTDGDVTAGIGIIALFGPTLIYVIAKTSSSVNAYRKLPPVVIRLESDGVHKLAGRSRANTLEWAKIQLVRIHVESFTCFDVCNRICRAEIFDSTPNGRVWIPKMKVEEWEVQEPLKLIVDALMTHAPDPTIQPVAKTAHSFSVHGLEVGRAKVFDYRWQHRRVNPAQSVNVDLSSNAAAPTAAMTGSQLTATHEPAIEAPAATPL